MLKSCLKGLEQCPAKPLLWVELFPPVYTLVNHILPIWLQFKGTFRCTVGGCPLIKRGDTVHSTATDRDSKIS